jgi:hypothetical protein
MFLLSFAPAEGSARIGLKLAEAGKASKGLAKSWPGGHGTCLVT